MSQLEAVSHTPNCYPGCYPYPQRHDPAHHPHRHCPRPGHAPRHRPNPPSVAYASQIPAPTHRPHHPHRHYPRPHHLPPLHRRVPPHLRQLPRPRHRHSRLDQPRHRNPNPQPALLRRHSFNGISDGILAGDRLGGGKGVAGPPLPAEKNSLPYDRPGLLGMSAPSKSEAPTPANLTSSSVLFLLEHADLEYTKRGGTIFGLCDEASLPIITALSHTLLSTDNHPNAPLAINHIAVLKPDEPPPPLTPNLPSANITPQPLPTPIAALPARL